MKRFLLLFLYFAIAKISVAQTCGYSVTTIADTTVCGASPVQLSTSLVGTPPSNATYSWLPTTGLNNPSSTNPTANPTNTTTYTVKVAGQSGINLVTNGSFEAGNTGFTTSYSVGGGGAWGPVSSDGTYLVTSNPNLAHSNFVSCTDHTPAPGVNMMVVNGSTVANANIWCQTIAVTPNTNYMFTMWGNSAVSGSPAVLQVKFNGVPFNTNLNLTTVTCFWQPYIVTWNSGVNTSVSICITNANLAIPGNDYAIDDISLYEICENTASVTITKSPDYFIDETANICSGDSIWLGGAYRTTAGNYLDTFATFNGCDSIIGTALTIRNATKPDLGADTTLCANTPVTLSSSVNHTAFEWNTGSTVDSITVNTAGTYILKATNNYGCTASDTVLVAYVNYPIVALGNDTTLCLGDEWILKNAEDDASLTYLWQDGSTDATYTVQEPGGNYSLAVTRQGCTASDDIMIDYETCSCTIDVPNSFTPNSDGINDIIKPLMQNGCEVVNYSFKVFNRWGKLIFSTTNINEGWNGLTNGTISNQDTYVWSLDYTLDPRFNANPVRKTGAFLLVN